MDEVIGMDKSTSDTWDERELGDRTIPEGIGKVREALRVDVTLPLEMV